MRPLFRRMTVNTEGRLAPDVNFLWRTTHWCTVPWGNIRSALILGSRGGVRIVLGRERMKAAEG